MEDKSSIVGVTEGESSFARTSSFTLDSAESFDGVDNIPVSEAAGIWEGLDTFCDRIKELLL